VRFQDLALRTWVSGLNARFQYLALRTWVSGPRYLGLSTWVSGPRYLALRTWVSGPRKLSILRSSYLFPVTFLCVHRHFSFSRHFSLRPVVRPPVLPARMQHPGRFCRRIKTRNCRVGQTHALTDARSEFIYKIVVFGLAYPSEDFVFRFLIIYNSLRDFAP
jgi:hypothetical protein